MDAEKVYVALGNDLQEGFKTLQWTIRKWRPQPISIVILQVADNFSKDFVDTPFGKLPASSMNDEKLQILKKYEAEKTDKLFSKYLAFCGKIKAEILKIERYDEPIHKLILDLISGLRITKLVMGITFLKFSSWKSRSAISGSFSIHQNKPDYCEFFIICGGKLVSLNEGIVEEDQGTAVAKTRDKANFRSWIARVFTDLGRNPNNRLSLSFKDLDSPESLNDQWQTYVQEIENYFQHLLSLNLDQENSNLEDENSQTTLMEDDPNMSGAEKREHVRRKIREALEETQSLRNEAKEHAQRYTKAEWAICLCNARVEQFEALIKEEVTNRMETQELLKTEKEQHYRLIREVEDDSARLESLLQIQSDLSNKLRQSASSKSIAEAELDKLIVDRVDLVRQIEELRRQRDVLHRRIDFCREKDAIGEVTRSTESISCCYREYLADDVRLATDDFSQRLRLKSGGDWTNVYRGRFHYLTVAVKQLRPLHGGDLHSKVRLLGELRHPHLVSMFGFCKELNCIIMEYMHSGNLKDLLLSSPRTSTTKYSRVLRWPDRIRIAHEISLGLGFLHSAQPKPLVHGNLTPSNVLLDRNLVAKITGFGLTKAQEESEVASDIKAFGRLLLNLLTGRNWAGLVKAVMGSDRTARIEVLDEMTEQWPMDLAAEFTGIAIKCISADDSLRIGDVMVDIENLRRKADDLKKQAKISEMVVMDKNLEDSSDVPSVFICPILQDVMENPHVAADGFSYELGAMEEWLGLGHDTSPMTNLKLKHKFLTPNHTLRSLIQDWQKKKTYTPS